MKTSLILLTTLLAILPFSCQNDKSHSAQAPGLEFVFQDKTDIEAVRCYRVTEWDSTTHEIHSGIDISPKYTYLAGTTNIKYVPVVAPADGTIELVLVHNSGANIPMISIALKMNDYWRLIMSFESQSSNNQVNEQQTNSLQITQGETVHRGQIIGNLIIGHIMTNRYPHIHFGVLYISPEDSLLSLLSNIDAVPRNNNVPAPPDINETGSPFFPSDLGLDSQFFCPYLYFSEEAKGILTSVPMYSLSNTCTCICAYNSVNGDCGDCTP